MSTKADAPARLFSERTEVISTAIVLGFLFLVPLEFFFFPLLLSGAPARVIAFAYWIFYLGVAHQGTSIALLLALPEFRTWMRERTGGQAWKYVAKCALFFSGVFAAVFYLSRFGGLMPAFLMAGYLAIRHSSGFWHLIQQFKGMSLQYNQRIRESHTFTTDETARSFRLQKLEKQTFEVLTWVSVATYTMFIYSIFGGWPMKPWVLGGILISFAAVVGLFEIARRFPHSSNSYKTAYLYRACFVPFKSFSLTSSLFLHLLHGCEYFLLLDHMVGRSTGRRRAARIFLACAVPLALITLFANLLRPTTLGASLFPSDYGHSYAYAALMGLCAAIEYTHYFLDRQMFRFTNALNRKHIGPLLAANPLPPPHEGSAQPAAA